MERIRSADTLTETPVDPSSPADPGIEVLLVGDGSSLDEAANRLEAGSWITVRTATSAAAGRELLSAGVTDYVPRAVVDERPDVLTDRVERAAGAAVQRRSERHRQRLFAKAQGIEDIGAWEYESRRRETAASPPPPRLACRPPTPRAGRSGHAATFFISPLRRSASKS